MDITNSVFFNNLPEIQKAISESTFISIDCELTGLKGDIVVNQFDTPQQYYEKVYVNSKDFLIFQFGLCIFRYDKATKKFKHQSYNFYIFPRPVNKNVPDIQFLCQASSIDFLIKHGFDFNKLFKEGISYLNTNATNKYKQAVLDRYNTRMKQISSNHSINLNANISVPIEDKPFIDEVIEKVKTFIPTDLSELALPKCNAFQRRLIYQSVQNMFGNQVGIESRQLPNNERMIVITRPKTSAKLMEEEKLTLEKDYQEIEKSVGFSTLIKYITKSGKLVVGHNMVLDIMQAVDKFHNPLPKEYDSFKETLHNVFPQIIDTKFMSSLGLFKDLFRSTVLAHLLSACSVAPFSLPKLEVEKGKTSYTIDCNKEHEAGYDAFITGLCFISMWKYLDNKKDLDFSNFDLIKPYMNRLFLMRICDEPYIRLDGPDGKIPSRDHVFHLKFPNTWKTNDIIQLFSPFGNIFIAWIDASSAYIALHKHEQSPVALSTLSQSDTYSIMTFANYQNVLKLNKTSQGKSGKKRTFDNPSNVYSNPIKEICDLKMNETSEDAAVPVFKKPHVKKTFQENSTWE